MVIDATSYPLSPILKPRMHQARLSVFLMLTSFQIDTPYATNNDIAILCQVIRFFSVRHKFWDNNNKKKLFVRIISIL